MNDEQSGCFMDFPGLSLPGEAPPDICTALLQVCAALGDLRGAEAGHGKGPGMAETQPPGASLLWIL